MSELESSTSFNPSTGKVESTAPQDTGAIAPEDTTTAGTNWDASGSARSRSRSRSGSSSGAKKSPASTDRQHHDDKMKKSWMERLKARIRYVRENPVLLLPFAVTGAVIAMSLMTDTTILLTRALLLYYGYCTYKAISTQSFTASDNFMLQIHHWIRFWCVASWMSVTDMFDFLSYYRLLKLAALVYLGQFHGSVAVYDFVTQMCVSKYEKNIDKVLKKIQGQTNSVGESMAQFVATQRDAVAAANQ